MKWWNAIRFWLYLINFILAAATLKMSSFPAACGWFCAMLLTLEIHGKEKKSTHA